MDVKNVELERLEEVAKRYDDLKSLSNVGVLLGKSRQFFYTYKKHKGIGKDVLNELKGKLKINPLYIQHGELPMRLGEEYSSNISDIHIAKLVRVPKIENMTINQLKQLKLQLTEYLSTIDRILTAYEGS